MKQGYIRITENQTQYKGSWEMTTEGIYRSHPTKR